MAELQQQQAELQQQYYAVLDDRNRLASRVEQLCRELEKNKTAGDQSMDRVMQANARLLEEKDRLTGELERVSSMYAQQTAASGAQAQAGGSYGTGFGVQGGGNDGALQEQVQSLTAQLGGKDDAIRKLETENASLKARIRKLAVS